MTAFLAITDAVAAALVGSPALGRHGKVLRGRRTPLAQADQVGLRVNAVRHTGTGVDIDGVTTQWETLVVVGLLVRALPDQDAEAAADPLLSDVWARLQAVVPPVGVTQMVLDPVITRDIDEADQTVAVANFSMRVVHLTQGAALAA